MTLALCIACWSTFAAAEVPAVHGASLVAPRSAAVTVEGGLATVFPTVAARIDLGLAPGSDLGVGAVTHAGLAHAVGIRARYAPRGGPWAVALALDEAFFTVEQLGGIAALHAPFGHRTAITPAVGHRRQSRAGVTLGSTVGAEIPLAPVADLPGGPARVFEPSLALIWGEVAATWPGEGGRTSVRFRAMVPVGIDFHPLGYLPHVAVGRTWGLR